MATSLSISREKHLDHMIRVVPFIVLGYSLQCYVILQIGAKSFAVDSLIFLGFGLCLMITGFIAYDIKHKVTLYESHLEISFNLMAIKKNIQFSDIKNIETGDPDQSFNTITLFLSNGDKVRFFFVDDAAGVKKWIEENKCGNQLLAA